MNGSTLFITVLIMMMILLKIIVKMIGKTTSAANHSGKKTISTVSSSGKVAKTKGKKPGLQLFIINLLINEYHYRTVTCTPMYLSI
jgi:hypothetical protein